MIKREIFILLLKNRIVIICVFHKNYVLLNFIFHFLLKYIQNLKIIKFLICYNNQSELILKDQISIFIYLDWIFLICFFAKFEIETFWYECVKLSIEVVFIPLVYYEKARCKDFLFIVDSHSSKNEFLNETYSG